MKRLALVLLLSACAPNPTEFDHPVEPGGTGAFASGWTEGESGPAVDAGTPGGGGDGGIGGADGGIGGGDGGIGVDGGLLGDAGGLGADAGTQLDAGSIGILDAGVTPTP